MPGNYSVMISNLYDAGELLCKNLIDVNYSQPDDAGSSVVDLTTDAAGAIIKPPSFTVSDTSGIVTFGVSFPGGTSLSGCTVTATITNNQTQQASNQKTDISVECNRRDEVEEPDPI